MQKKLVNAALLASLFVLALTGCSGQPAATNGGEKVNDGAKAAPDSGGAKKKS